MSGVVLPLTVAVPLLAAAALAPVRGAAALRRILLFAVLSLALAVHVSLVVALRNGGVLTHDVGSWPGGIAITFAADMFSALMLTITGLLTLVCCAFAMLTGEGANRYFPSLTLVLFGGVCGALLTADLFNLFVFVEVMLAPSYVLISLFGGAWRVRAGRLYVVVNLLASTAMLIGIAGVYGLTATVNLADLAGSARDSPAVALAAGIILVVFCVKAAVFPVYGWLPNTYPYTSAAVSALFSGLHTKVAIYAIYRIYAVVYDGDARYLGILLAVFTITMVVGVFGAVGEATMRSILAFHMVSQFGYILLGVALFGPMGLTAGIFYLLHHMNVKASLFLSVGAVEVTYGAQRLEHLGGVARRSPTLGVAFIGAAFSLAGIPPFSGFVAKFLLIRAAVVEEEYIAAGVAVAVSLVTLMSMVKIWNSVFWGRMPRGGDPEREGMHDVEVPRVRSALIVPALVLTLLSLGLGVGAELLVTLSERAAEGLVDTGDYVREVSG